MFADPTGVQPWRLGETELVTVTAGLSQHIVECEALRVRLVTDLETRGTAKALGAGSTASWLSGTTRMAPGAATGIVKLGQALTEWTDTADALHAATTLGGRGMVKANFDAETMEMLLTALSALSAPRPGTDGTADRRSAARRRADAFTELLRRYLNSAASPVEGYERPHLSLLIHAADLASTDPADQAPADPAGTPAEHDHTTQPKHPAAAHQTTKAEQSTEPERPAPDRGAFEALFGTRPGTPGWMPWLGPLSTASARRIACDCELTAILLDDNGVPLNLGRSERLVSPQQRRALIARDHGCAFPACGRPPAWTQAHHIIHWIDCGTTDLANLVLLCTAHHRVIHHNGWDITMGTDGHPWFLPPQWMDPLREPRPAHHRRNHPHHTAA